MTSAVSLAILPRTGYDKAITAKEMERWKKFGQALYGEGGLWVRPAAMWNETVERGGQTFRRFIYVGEA